MELQRRDGIAIGLFTSSIIALTFIIIDLAKNLFQKSLIILVLIELNIILVLIGFILISFKAIRYPSMSFGFIGDKLKKIGF
jgi:hypothetical protein